MNINYHSDFRKIKSRSIISKSRKKIKHFHDIKNCLSKVMQHQGVHSEVLKPNFSRRTQLIELKFFSANPE